MTIKSSRFVLIVILVMFLLPLALAWLMYNGTVEFEPEKTSNQGVLITPPLPLDWSGVKTSTENIRASLDESWVVLYPLAQVCSTTCQNLLTGLRQMHIASGRNRNRIVIALLLRPDHPAALGTEIMQTYKHFTILSNPSALFSASLQQAEDRVLEGNKSANIFLIDPLGNIMMSYNGADSPSRLNHDLKRLLKWSKLDKRS